jgi:hypothetical protein
MYICIYHLFLSTLISIYINFYLCLLIFQYIKVAHIVLLVALYFSPAPLAHENKKSETVKKTEKKSEKKNLKKN